jgi:predicted N-acetyltransferase YhbS
MDYQIVKLPKEDWKGHILKMDYTSYDYFDVDIAQAAEGYNIGIYKKPLDSPVKSEALGFPDRLYLDHWEKAYAWGILNDGQLIAAIETCPEEWSNRLMITELWVDEKYRRQGLGHRLMAVAKEQLRHERRRALILETQSCNTAAIAFYQSEGFTLMGFDTCCYSNNDLQRREVRLNFCYMPPKKAKLTDKDIIIKEERPGDYYEVENMTKRAFWNKHRPGCDEHLLVHKLRDAAEYIPELSRIAVLDNKIVGCIMYSKSYITDGKNKTEVLTFGPLCVDPDYQGLNIGRLLLKETIKLASQHGYRAIVIYGEPDYYPLFGFKTCDNYGITTPDGANFPAFMCYELYPGSLDGIRGRFYEAEVFKNLSPEETESFDRNFPYLPKLSFPGQWA